jgi:uncharacterized protein (TIGR03083 family)
MSALAAMIAEERQELYVLLRSLRTQEWNASTLCAPWRVRDVAAHVVSYDNVSPASFLARFVMARLDVDRMNAQLVGAWSQRPTSEVLSALEASLRPRGAMRFVPRTMALFDVLVHQQDIRRPLARRRQVPEERLVPVLNYLRRDRFDVGGARRARGLRLVATDIGWSTGRGPEVRGTGEALAMALAGRGGVADELGGDGKPIMKSRLCASSNR